ncbi:MAG TPA: helix-turn-helix domain-containing protein [Burkholderiaceae bacterium]|nr:helix-turn-helix domain-containing protein [Burkholderiaceae bacterium]
MSIQVDVFDDFHLHGASAPEWNQRYAQLSPGAMHSTLTEATSGRVHVFRKWMSERVVQQGCLPGGQICFALLNGCADGLPRMQGQELRENHLVVLRGGEEFAIQRPRGMELLAITFPNEDFLQLLDERPRPQQARKLLSRHELQAPADALRRLRGQLMATLRLPLSGHADSQALGDESGASAGLFESLRALFEDACDAQPTVASASAAYIVAQCHRIVVDSGDAPPDVETLCRRLRVSRRSVQYSFRQMANSTTVHYLRSLRLNLVRQRLLATSPAQLSVSQAAGDQGFEQLSHFTERYKALFGELPSETNRAQVARPPRQTWVSASCSRLRT